MTPWGEHGAVSRTHAIIAGAVLVALTLAAVPAAAQTSGPPQPAPPPPSAERELAERLAEKEALKQQIHEYSAMVQALRETLAARETTAPRTEEIERTVQELSLAIGEITDQLADLDLEVVDNRVRLRDGHGGEVTLEIPEDLPEQLSAGLSSITRMFLDELPDTVRIDEIETGFNWSFGDRGIQILPAERPAKRRVIEGGLVKIRDDMEIKANEDVDGDAVAIMGDATVAGRVTGDLVVVLGDVELAETAVVDGQVIAILGRLDRADGAEVGSVTVVSPGDAGLSGGWSAGSSDWVAFGSFQLLFLILVACALLLMALIPRARLEMLVETAERRLAASLGLGLLAVFIGHVLVVGLAGILVLTVIGIPVALLVLAALLVLDLAGIAIGAATAGRWFCGRLGLPCVYPWRELLLGLGVLHVPAFVSSALGAVAAPVGLVLMLGWIGAMVKVAALAIGLGALLLGRFGASSTAPPTTPPGTPLVENPGG